MTLQLHDTSNRATGSSFTNLSFFERAFALDFRLLLRLPTSSRIISSFALRSFHQSALALQNGVPYAPARGHTREPAQQGCPAPRTSNDGRDARQLAPGLAQDRHLQLPHVHASLAQKLVGPQYYRTAGSARHDPRVALSWSRYGSPHGQQDSGERPDGELPSVHTLRGWAARPSG